MFLDGDDELVPNACQIAYEAIEKYHTDIVQFNVDIINHCAYSTLQEIEDVENSKKAFLESICGEKKIIFACWKDRKFGHNIWNKIYKHTICKQAIQHTKVGNIFYAEDVYLFFTFAYYAKSSIGIPNKLYTYNYGLGISGSQEVNGVQFVNYLEGEKVVGELQRFLRSVSEGNEMDEIVTIIRKNLLIDLIHIWINHVITEDQSIVFKQLINTFGLNDTLQVFRELYKDILNNVNIQKNEIQKQNEYIIKINRAIRDKDYDFNCIVSSFSFRLGRILTFIPRKLRDSVRSLVQSF